MAEVKLIIEEGKVNLNFESVAEAAYQLLTNAASWKVSHSLGRIYKGKVVVKSNIEFCFKVDENNGVIIL